MSDPPPHLQPLATAAPPREPGPARFGELRVRTLFRPADFVSGDIYDVRQLDDRHVGVALADATGHSLPAALLTVYFRRALYHSETQTLEPPDAVLRRLNEELLEAEFAECRFVAVTYAIINIETGAASLARGGTPYPFLRRSDGTLDTLRPDGGLVGVLPEAQYDVAHCELAAGDALVIFSDGLEALLLPEPDVDDADCDAPLRRAPWAALLRERGPDAALDELAVHHERDARLGRELDDLTAIVIARV